MGGAICFYASFGGDVESGAATVEAEEAATLWTTLQAAGPRYPGHVQPFLPRQTDEVQAPLSMDVRRRHGEIARAHGVFAFCYAQRGFGLGPFLTAVLADGLPALPFMLAWHPPLPGADETADDVQAHQTALLACFRDARYVRVGGQPVIGVARPGGDERMAHRLERWRASAREAGLPGLHVVALLGGDPCDARYLRSFDAACAWTPGHARAVGLSAVRMSSMANAEVAPLLVASAEEALTRVRGAVRLHPVQYPGVHAAYDASLKGGDEMHVSLSHDGLRDALATCLRDAAADPLLPAPLVFVHSWNGWLDGSAITPSQPEGTARLEAMRRAVEDAANSASKPSKDEGTPVPLTADLVKARVPTDIGWLVVRLSDPVHVDPVWDRLAAALALEPGVGVIDCAYVHRHRAALALQADVLGVTRLEPEIVDLLAARHAMGKVSWVETDAWEGDEALSDATTAGRRRLGRDLVGTALRYAQAAPQHGGALARALQAFLAQARERPCNPPHSLPPLPAIGESRRFVLGAESPERRLEVLRACPPDARLLSQIETLLQEVPGYLQARWLHLSVLNGLGEGARAEREARRLLAEMPADTRARTELAGALSVQARHAEAMAELSLALDQNPHQVRAWTQLLSLLEPLPQAPLEAVARRAIDANPRNWALAHLAAQAVRPPSRRAFLADVVDRLAPTLEPVERVDVRNAFVPLLASEALAWPLAEPSERGDGVAPAFGVDLVGYFRARTGLSQGARAVARALVAAGIPHRVDSWTDVDASLGEPPVEGTTEEVSYRFHLVHANADELAALVQRRGDGSRGRRRIGLWNWELAIFPDAWTPAFRYLDEVWVPSAFTRQAVASKASIPVLRMPYSVTIPDRLPDTVTRAAFGVPEGAFAFLFAFDGWSYPARKNPLAVVKAFREAFGDRRDAYLLVKVLHAATVPGLIASLVEAIGRAPNIGMTLRGLSRDEMYGLTGLCDAYVSLHRAEGFGLPLAEAMLLGKPVVATGYSGNLEFMNVHNSLLVEHRMVEIEEDVGPYTRGNVWADPDIAHAAQCLRRVVDDRSLAARLGAQARLDMARSYSAAAIGQRIRDRLTAIDEGRA